MLLAPALTGWLSRAAAQADGYPMDDMTQSEVEACMRGPSSSIAVLTIAGPSPDSPHRLVDLERRDLPQPPVKQVGGRAHVRVCARVHEFVRVHACVGWCVHPS